MGEQVDYYAILGVAPNSEQIVIQAAYRALMRRYHPDTNDSSDAAARAQAINEAYGVLSDANRRARYDRARSSRQNAGDAAPPPPPPPPPQGQSSAREPNEHLEAGRKANRRGLAALGVYTAALAVVGIIFLASQGSRADPSGDNTMNVDNLAVDNLVISDTQAADDAGYAADAALNAVIDEPVQPKHLSDLPVAAVEYSNIENAAQKFASVFMRDGISGARAFSEDCHRRTTESPSWQAADYCAAFDYAAATIDQAVTRQAGWPESGYFRFQAQNQADQYAAAGAPSYMTTSRLSQIEGAAASAARDAVSAALARSQAKRKVEAAQPPPETAEPSNVAGAGDEQRLD